MFCHVISDIWTCEHVQKGGRDEETLGDNIKALPGKCRRLTDRTHICIALHRWAD